MGKRSRELIAIGATEAEYVREMAYCRREMATGRWPNWVRTPRPARMSSPVRRPGTDRGSGGRSTACRRLPPWSRHLLAEPVDRGDHDDLAHGDGEHVLVLVGPGAEPGRRPIDV